MHALTVSFLLGTNYEGHIRGGRLQASKTAEHLRRLGVSVVEASNVAALPQQVDLCHVFGIQDSRYLYTEVEAAKERAIPVVVSPIWWDFERSMLPEQWFVALESGWQTWVRLAKLHEPSARLLFMAINQARLVTADRRRSRALSRVEAVLPNAIGEAEAITPFLKGSQPHIACITNGIDQSIFFPTGMERDIPVLFVGIVDRTKNVHRLISAVNQLGVQLTVVGQAPNPGYRHFCEACDERSLVTWLGPVDHTDLAGLYNRAQVVALCSMRETPGLAVLEGAACGANVVITKFGTAREYFCDLADYCDPLSIADIERALRRALKKQAPNVHLSRYVRQTFTWSAAAAQTLAAYKAVLASHSAGSKLTSQFLPQRTGGVP